MIAVDYKLHRSQMTLSSEIGYEMGFLSSSNLSGDNLWPKRRKEQERFNSLAPSTSHTEFISFRNEQDVLEKLLKERQLYTTMSMGQEIVVTHDPIVEVLDAFYSIPGDFHAALFRDFQDAADAQDLRRLLDTISDWAATAELYADTGLASDLSEAIGGREGVADWLPG